ncbi:hypothetical protein J7E68_17235 [Microbacterium sp. ISL-103]|uniref:DUF6510 family protein n=1 Tax=Microbacterium sp. ISL-103 TaxID=2819156 RepID=UPI001BE85FCA|nr:DUF6510 family protein [Microbacterium sp. ISL-103]MBT2476267.1 hypothetical protein [Microbacterium sp. ISL-103]
MDAVHPGHRKRVDGNAAGGMLLEFFGRDMTAARAICAHCDREAELGDAIAELDSAGVILLCRGCGRTLLTCLRFDGQNTLVIDALVRLEWRADGD